MSLLVILGVLTYFTVAPLLASRVCLGDKEPTRLLQWTFIYLATPATMCWLILFGLWWIPYFWLYPERHAHSVDIFGSDEEKAAMNEFRHRSSERSFIRRCLEFSGLCIDTRPIMPQNVIEFEERERVERGVRNT